MISRSAPFSSSADALPSRGDGGGGYPEFHAQNMAVSGLHPSRAWTKLRLGALVAVLAIHFGLLVSLFFGQSAPAIAERSSQIIMASVIAPLPQQNLTEAPKPLATVRKRRPNPSRTAISVEKTATTESDIVAPPPEPEDAVPPAEDPSESGAFVEAQSSADYLKNAAPDYPRMSRRLGEEGRVVLRVFVEKDGKPKNVTVHQSSGFPRLDRAALIAVKLWIFVPARQGSEDVSAWVLVPITFNLRGQ